MTTGTTPGISEVRVPNENVNDETVTILQWRVADGDRVAAEQPLVEVETSKANFDIPAPAAGVVRMAAANGAEVRIGAVICYIGDNAAAIDAAIAKTTQSAEVASEEPAAVAQSEPAPAPPPGSQAIAPSIRGTSTRIGPKARAALRNNGLSEEQFRNCGLVTEQHVLEFLAARDGKPAPRRERGPAAAKHETAAQTEREFSTSIPVDRRELPRSKRLEARYLGWSRANALPSLVTVAVPTRGLRLRPQCDPAVPGLISAAIIFESSRLLLRFPQFNAFHASGALNVYKEVNIGFAIEAGQGLKVPIIRHASTKTLPQIISEKQSLLIGYLDNQLTPEHLFGGTFTVTDLSGEGAFSFLPLINQGQSAILGVGAELATGSNGGGMYNLILAFDHQVADGRAAAQFLTELRDRMVGYEASLIGPSGGGNDAPEAACEMCYRSVSELHALKRHLLKAVGPAGADRLICTICAEGW